MKLHLPRLLATAVLAAFAAAPVYSYPLHSPNELTGGKIDGDITYELFNGNVYTYSRTDATAPFISGSTGRDALLFTSVSGGDNVILSFAGGNTQAFYEINKLAFTNLSCLKFSGMSSGVIYSEGLGAEYATSLTISGITDNNTGTNDVHFFNNSVTGNCGGGINASSTAIGIDNNGGVIFEGNKAYAGAVSGGNQNQGTTGGGLGVAYGDGYSISLFGVKFSFEFGFNAGFSFQFDNPLTPEVEQMDICGGAINLYDSTLSLNGNQAVTFIRNSAVDYGGAISAGPGDTVSINNTSGQVIFQENKTTGHIQNNHVVGGGGGAIFVGESGQLMMDSNKSDIIFKDNSAAAAGGAIYFGGQSSTNDLSIIALTKNTGNISFVGNTAGGTGGAIHLQQGGRLEIASNTGDVIFEHNKAGVSGGAISALNAFVTIEHNTDNVIFRDNLVYHQIIEDADSFSNSYIGGAIYGTNIQIHNNGSVLFQRNAEKVADDFFRLRSLYVEGSSTDCEVSLSTSAGQSIEFRDSIYIACNLHLNSGYANLKQEGDIIFTGATTVEDLEKVKANWEAESWTTSSVPLTVSEKEIEASRTSVVLGETYLNGGRLRVEKGAIFQGHNIHLNEGSNSTLRIDDGKVVNIHSNSGTNSTSFIKVYKGSTLETLGNSTIEGGNLIFNDGAKWSFGLSDKNLLDNAALTFSGNSLDIAGKLTVTLDVSNSNMNEHYCLYEGKGATRWTAENITVVGLNDATGADFDDLVWRDGKLYYISSMVWGNNQGTWMWNLEDKNWQNGRAFANGMNVKFTDTAAGEVKLSGMLSAGVITMKNSTGNDYTFTAAEGGGGLAGSTELVKRGNGTLTLNLANSHEGFTRLEEGTLKLYHSDALGDSALTTASYTKLNVGNGAHVVLDKEGLSVAGNVLIDKGASLEIKGKHVHGYASNGYTVVNGTLKFTDTQSSGANLSGSNGHLQVVNSQVVFNRIDNTQTSNVNITVKGTDATLSVVNSGWTINGSSIIDIQGGTFSLGGDLRYGVNGNGSKISLTSDATATKKATLIAKGRVEIDDYAVLYAGLSEEILTLQTGDSLLNSIVAGVIDAPELALCERSTLTLNQSHIALNNGLLSFYKSTNPPGLILPPAFVHLNLTLDGLPMDGSHVVLFSGVDKLNLGGTSYTDSYTTKYQFNAQDYFDGAWIGENTILWYENGMVTLSGFVTPTIPEPTTATLSLLALAALAMRRRRK